MASTLPFQNLNNKEYNLTSKGIDLPNEVNIDEMSLSNAQENLIKEINIAINRGFNLNEKESDPDNEEEINPIDCKYYTTDQFNDRKFNSTKHFSILHLKLRNSVLH